jgi:hypothetical protein
LLDAFRVPRLEAFLRGFWRQRLVHPAILWGEALSRLI